MEWISVKDQLPDKKEPVVYCNVKNRTSRGDIGIGIAYWTISDKWNPDLYSEKDKCGFTHWMPLPPPPKEVE